MHVCIWSLSREPRVTLTTLLHPSRARIKCVGAVSSLLSLAVLYIRTELIDGRSDFGETKEAERLMVLNVASSSCPPRGAPIEFAKHVPLKKSFGGGGKRAFNENFAAS
jgi:hypothetical protein